LQTGARRWFLNQSPFLKRQASIFLQHEVTDAEKQMAKTDIEKALLKCPKNDHVTFKLKTLTANPAATQKTIRANLKLCM
jgi:hypothetical protein